MAIQPIDLQTMYSSLDKVSKLTAQKQQSIQLQSAIQQDELTKQLQAKVSAVEETDMDDEGPTHVKDRKHNDAEKQSSSEEREEQQEESPEEKVQVIKAPWLGQHIDVSG